MSSIPSNRPEYKVQSSRLTLADALVEYRRTHPEFGEQARAGSAAAAFFEGHDVCHVVFGCGTTPDEEVLADTWTLFGTDVSLSQFVGFLRLPEHTDIVRQVGVAGACGALLRAAPRAVRVVWRSRSMRRRWPWAAHGEYLNRELAEIREEFGVRVLE